jgi:cytochrome P450
MTQTSLPPFDIVAACLDGDPYPRYATYRTLEPVHVIPPDERTKEGAQARQILLFRHADVLASLRDNRMGRDHRNDPTAAPDTAETFSAMASHFMLFRDPPVHTRLRSVANMAFTPRRVEQMRPHIEATAASLIDQMRERGPEVDLIADFAFPLPMLVIAGMIGIPQEDFRLFRRVAGDIAAAIDVPSEGLQEFVARVDQSTAELIAYLRDLIAERRADPRDDLLTSMIQAEATEGRLNERELIATCILLIVAGHETTVNLIGNGVLAFMRNRDQWQALVDDPSLARNAAEEALRYDAPVQFTSRVVKEQLEMGGVTFQPGDWVNMMLGSANRDETVFADPDRFDIRRDVGRIASFGMGIHFCLGAPLARLEGEIAFRSLSQAFPTMTLATSAVRWRPGAVFHGLQELPLRLA